MNLLRNLYYLLPPSMRFLARRLYYFPVDIYEKWSGKRDPLTPPRGMIYTGSGDFRKQGETMLGHFIDAGLQPHHRVLDIGSGIGRMAVPLTQYLREKGSYEGFDVVKTGVDWCRQNISSRYPNFRFTYIPLENDLYRSEGKEAADFQFPYPSGDFDFVILTSVFTHMLPPAVANYLMEISRVMKLDAVCFATFFLWNDETERLAGANPAFSFPFDHGHYRLMSEKVQSANVAYNEKYLWESMLPPTGLRITEMHYGYWSGRPKEACKDFQDIVILARSPIAERL